VAFSAVLQFSKEYMEVNFHALVTDIPSGEDRFDDASQLRTNNSNNRVFINK
jgi:hypothetical protein